jgi:hypothetical protein
VTVSLAGLAQGIRDLFAGIAGQDLAQNPHILTRAYARGLSFQLTILGVDPTMRTGNNTVPLAGCTVLVAVQKFDGSNWSTVLTLTGGPTPSSGQVQLSDTSGLYDTTLAYQLAVQVTYPDGSVSAWISGIIMWAGSAAPGGGYPGNWGQGFMFDVLTPKLVGIPPNTQGISISVAPTTGQSPLNVKMSALVFIPKAGQKLMWSWLGSNGAWNQFDNNPVATFQFTYDSAVYCVLTDTDGTTYQSPTVAITVS